MKKTLAALLLTATAALAAGSAFALDDSTNGTGTKDFFFDLKVPRILEANWDNGPTAAYRISFDFSDMSLGLGATDARGVLRADNANYRYFLSNNIADTWFAPTTTAVPHLTVLSNQTGWKLKVWEVDSGSWTHGSLSGPAANQSLTRLQTFLVHTGSGSTPAAGSLQNIVISPTTLIDSGSGGTGQNDYDFYFYLRGLLNDQFTFDNGVVTGAIEADVAIFQP